MRDPGGPGREGPDFLGTPPRHLSEALASTLEVVRASIRVSTVRVLLLDGQGRLRVVAAQGRGDRGGRLRSSRRRAVLRTGRGVIMGGSGDRRLVLHPLSTGRGRPIGLIEAVTADPEAIWRPEVLEAVASQAAAAIVAARERARFERELEAAEAMVALAWELLRTRTVGAAIRAATDHLHEHLGVPVVGLLWRAPEEGWEVARIRGYGARRRAELRTALEDAGLRSSTAHLGAGLHRVEEVVARVTRTDEVTSRRAGPALLLVVGASPGAERLVGRAATMLTEAIRQAEEIERARLLTRDLDIGIAWTAHELRAPLVGARQAIDHVLHRDGSPAVRESMLRQTQRELSDLSDLVDPLLRWSSGGRRPPRRRLDLSALVREAVELERRGRPDRRVRVRAQEGVMVRGHAPGLRTAVANLLRNAITYSPDGGAVEVWVGVRKGMGTVVVSDGGPGVPEHDRERIFEPFARGHVGGRNGRGLGLFIARQIVEAHGGTIGVELRARGSRFRLEIPPALGGPRAEERGHRSAS